MIDDDWRIIKKLAENNIKTLYFRDTNLKVLEDHYTEEGNLEKANLKVLEENKYIKEVNNWGQVYRFIKDINKI